MKLYGIYDTMPFGEYKGDLRRIGHRSRPIADRMVSRKYKSSA